MDLEIPVPRLRAKISFIFFYKGTFFTYVDRRYTSLSILILISLTFMKLSTRAKEGGLKESQKMVNVLKECPMR